MFFVFKKLKNSAKILNNFLKFPKEGAFLLTQIVEISLQNFQNFQTPVPRSQKSKKLIEKF